MTSKGLVLVTGANGYIAARTVEALLQAGFSVRGTVRSLASAAAIQETLARTYGPDRVEMVEVPDILAPGAFDAAMAGGVTAVAHLASPVSFSFTDPDPVIQTAVGATLAALQAAHKAGSVRAFVFMSSITAVASRPLNGQAAAGGPAAAPARRFTEADWNDSIEELVAQLGKDAPGGAIYAASKNAAERAFWRWRDENKPTFTMAAINPVFVIGAPLVLPASPAQLSLTTEFIWQVFSGQEIPPALAGQGFYVDVRDVARLVVFGIENGDRVDGERFIAAAASASPQAAADVLRPAYPDRRAIIQEGNPGKGYLPGYAFPPERFIDGSKAVRVTGQDYISFEQSVLDAAKAFEAYL